MTISRAIVAPKMETRPMPTFSNVVAGQTSELILPTGFNYHFLLLSYTNLTLAQMLQIRFLANGEVFQTFTATVRDTLNQFDGFAASAGILAIPFHRINLFDTLQEYLTAIPTGVNWGNGYKPITDFRMQIDIAGGAVNPALACKAVVSDANGEQSKGIIRIDSYSENVSVAAEYLLQRKLTGDKLRPDLSRITFADTNAHITNLRFGINGTDSVTRSSLENELIQKMKAFRHPQAGYVIYDTTEHGESDNMIPIGSISQLDLRITSTVVNAGLPVIAETIGRLAA